MRRKTAERLVAESIRQVLMAEPPVVFDSLVVDFVHKTVTFRGSVVQCDGDGITLPVLSTDHFIVPRDGSAVL